MRCGCSVLWCSLQFSTLKFNTLKCNAPTLWSVTLFWGCVNVFLWFSPDHILCELPAACTGELVWMSRPRLASGALATCWIIAALVICPALMPIVNCSCILMKSGHNWEKLDLNRPKNAYFQQECRFPMGAGWPKLFLMVQHQWCHCPRRPGCNGGWESTT